jgi:hypothetical protein
MNFQQYNVKSFMASGIKTGRKAENMWRIKMVADLIKLNWSFHHHRTLKPEAPSPALVTPGSNKSDFIMSTSQELQAFFLWN